MKIIGESSTYRSTTLATYIMIGLILIGILATLSGITIHSRSTKILQMLYQQKDVWEQIKKVAFSDIKFTNEEFSNRYKIRRLKHMSDLLLESSNNHQILKKLEKENRVLFYFSRYRTELPVLKRETSVLSIHSSLSNLLKDPESFVLSTPDISNSSLGFTLSNDVILSMLEESIELAQKYAKSDMHKLYIIAFSAGIFTIIGMLLIRRFIILPAISRLTESHLLEVQYQQEIQEQKLLTASAFLSLTDAAVVFDKNGRLVVKNEAFSTLSQAIDHAKTPLEFFQSIVKDTVPYPAYRENLSIPAISALLTNVDHIKIGGRLVNWASNCIEGNYWIFVGRDRTELVEKQKITYHNERLEALGRVASGVAHDFNNILGSIIMRAEIALLPEDINENHREVYDGILESSFRGKAMISQLLSYTRKQTLFPASTPIIKIKKLISKQIRTPKNIELSISNTPKLSTNLDSNYLTTAIENIIQNSCFAIGNKPGKVSVLFEKIETEEIPLGLRITIEDNGGGFSKSALESATEPFFSTKGTDQGAGLGLAMVAGFVAQSHGVLTINNIRGGAQVKLTFPATVFTDPERVEPEALSLGTLKPKSVKKREEVHCLMLENEPMLGKLNFEFLRPYCNSITLVTTIKECFETIKENPIITMAIFDWNLADGTSEEVVRYFRLNYPDARIVLISGNICDEMLNTAKSCNTKLIAKPYRLHHFTEVLELSDYA